MLRDDWDSACNRIAELEAEVQHQVERREEEKLRAVNAEAERDAERKQHNWTIHVAANLINPLSQVDGVKTLTDAIMAARPPLPPPPR